MKVIRFDQAEVDADDMHGVSQPRDLDDAVKESSFFNVICGYVDILRPRKGILAQDCVAVMPIRIDGVFAVSVVGPELMSQKFELRLVRPVLDGLPMAIVVSDDFL